MTFRFLHTSDWQIGKVFRFVDTETMGLLQTARINVITKLGEIANKLELTHVLVAGDVYDMENLSTKTLNQPMERMRVFENIQWHLLPGNHDPQRPNGMWDRLVSSGLPSNVVVHQDKTPFLIENYSAAILPAPLFHKQSLDDPTMHMGTDDLPSGYVRIGLAHGSTREFGSAKGMTANYINVESRESYLSYLALGDWHGQQQISSKCWYSGTPEIDAFTTNNGGKALVVEVNSRDALPVVESVVCGQYTWLNLNKEINSKNDIDLLVNELRGLHNRLDLFLIKLAVRGMLSLEESNYFDQQVGDKLRAALCVLQLKTDELHAKPTKEDLNRIDVGGFVRNAAETLRRMLETGNESEKEIATRALLRLYSELDK